MSQEKCLASSPITKARFLVEDSEITLSMGNLAKYIDFSNQLFNDVIVVENCSPDFFNETINLLRNNEIDHFAVDSCEKALELLSLSEQLKCYQLYHASEQYLSENYNNEFIFRVFDHALRNNRKLAAKCLGYVVANAETALKQREFNEASLPVLIELCSNETMARQKLTLLVESLIKYAKHKLKGETTSTVQVREDLRPAVCRVPFLMFDAETFVKLDGIDHLLTLGETLDVLKKLNSACVDIPGLSTKSWVDNAVTFSYAKRAAPNCLGEVAYLIAVTEDIILDEIVLPAIQWQFVERVHVESGTQCWQVECREKKRTHKLTMEISKLTGGRVSFELTKNRPLRYECESLCVSHDGATILLSPEDGGDFCMIDTIKFRVIRDKDSVDSCAIEECTSCDYLKHHDSICITLMDAKDEKEVAQNYNCMVL